MKKVYSIVLTTVLLFLLAPKIWAADFTVKISLTDDYGHYIVPLKAGASIPFQINVKNNLTVNCNVGIDKTRMGIPSTWVAIDNNNQTIAPQQSTNFLITLTIPAGTAEAEYPMFLYFNAYDNSNYNHAFTYNTQIITVDNSVPNVPAFSASSSSDKIYVSGWSSFDSMSNTYTTVNSSSGISGIKSYTVVLKNPDNSVKETKTINATSYNYYTFLSLASNTNYSVSVTATDLAGNTNTNAQNAKTPPAQPTGLSFSNTTYAETTLSWTPSAGASGYDVYRFDGTSNIKINTNTITSNSFYITQLNPNTDYNFKIIAKSDAGSSVRSNNASIKTVILPIIAGQSTLCSGTSTYALNSILSGYSIVWTWSPQLTYTSGQGTQSLTVNYSGGNPLPTVGVSYIEYVNQNSIVNDYGFQVNVSATISNAVSSFVIDKKIWLGKPDFTPIVKGSSSISCSRSLFTELKYRTVTWSVYGPLRIVGPNYGHKCTVEGTGNGPGWVYATAANDCGSIRGEMLVEVNCGSYSVSPNPVYSTLSIDQNSGSVQSNGVNLNKPINSIKLYDKFGCLVYQQKFNKETYSTEINLSSIPVGFYIVKINEGNIEESYTIIKN